MNFSCLRSSARRHFWIIAFIVTCLICLSEMVVAQQPCQSVCETSGDRQFCVERCEQNNEHQRETQRIQEEVLRNDQGGSSPRPRLPPTVLWGHLAFDLSTGIWGSAYGYSNGVEARGRAFQECRKAGGKACEWRIPIRGGCVAIAQGDSASGRRGHKKSGGREALAVAQTKAVNECKGAGGRNCKVVAKVCSFGP